MASASDHRAHAALQPADCLILLPQRLPAAVETSIGPAHYPAECTQSDAFLQPSLRARKGRANSNSLQTLIRFFPIPNGSVLTWLIFSASLGRLAKWSRCRTAAKYLARGGRREARPRAGDAVEDSFLLGKSGCLRRNLK